MDINAVCEKMQNGRLKSLPEFFADFGIRAIGSWVNPLFYLIDIAKLFSYKQYHRYTECHITKKLLNTNGHIKHYKLLDIEALRDFLLWMKKPGCVEFEAAINVLFARYDGETNYLQHNAEVLAAHREFMEKHNLSLLGLVTLVNVFNFCKLSIKNTNEVELKYTLYDIKNELEFPALCENLQNSVRFVAMYDV